MLRHRNTIVCRMKKSKNLPKKKKYIYIYLLNDHKHYKRYLSGTIGYFDAQNLLW